MGPRNPDATYVAGDVTDAASLAGSDGRLYDRHSSGGHHRGRRWRDLRPGHPTGNRERRGGSETRRRRALHPDERARRPQRSPLSLLLCQVPRGRSGQAERHSVHHLSPFDHLRTQGWVHQSACRSGAKCSGRARSPATDGRSSSRSASAKSRKSFAWAVDNEHRIGQTYELGGPDILSYDEIIDIIQKQLGTSKKKAHLPAGLVGGVVTLSSPLPKKLRPPVTKDQLKMLDIDNCTDQLRHRRTGRPTAASPAGIGNRAISDTRIVAAANRDTARLLPCLDR